MATKLPKIPHTFYLSFKFVLVCLLCFHTHRQPANRILHYIGLPLYVIGIVLVAGDFIDLHTNSITGITLWLMAIGLFLTGHKIEGNLRAMTLIILFKYLKSRKPILTSHVR